MKFQRTVFELFSSIPSVSSPPSKRITCNTWRTFNLIFMSYPIWDFFPLSCKVWFRYVLSSRELGGNVVRRKQKLDGEKMLVMNSRICFVLFMLYSRNPQAANKITCNHRTIQAIQNDHIHSPRKRCYSRLNEANL